MQTVTAKRIGRPRKHKTAEAARKARQASTDKWLTKRREVIAATSTVTVVDLLAIVEREQGRCVFCRAPVETKCTPVRQPRGFDHIRAIAAGGRHVPTNIVVCCRSCNRKKGQHGADRLLFEMIDTGQVDRSAIERVPALRREMYLLDRRARRWLPKSEQCTGCVGRDDQIARLRELLQAAKSPARTAGAAPRPSPAKHDGSRGAASGSSDDDKERLADERRELEHEARTERLREEREHEGIPSPWR